MSADDFELIYQPIPRDGADDAFASALEDVVATSRTVAFASPYLSLNVLRPLAVGRSFRLVTDQNACFEAGFDAELVRFLEEHSMSVRSLRGLHAKVVLGDRSGLFGSANLTTSGLCRRFEMSAIVRGDRFEELQAWFEALWEHSTPLDLQALSECEHRADRSTQSSHVVTTGLSTTGRLGWLANPPVHSANAARVQDSGETVSLARGVTEQDIEELAFRLRELTGDHTTAVRVLDLLALALGHARLPVNDERLHLNFGRKERISVTLGQRHIAWCRRRGDVREFGMMLQSFDIAERAVAAIPGARQGAWTRKKVPEVPELYVPLSALDSLDQTILSDWERSIRRAAETCGKSSYRKKSRESLYHILLNPTLRQAAASLAHPPA